MVIVDAFNVLHAARTVHEGLSGLTLGALVGLVGGSRWASGPVVLVCDGAGSRGVVDPAFLHPDAPIRVVFAGPGKDADSLIERMVIDAERRGSGRGAGHITVVSSDKGVLASAVGPIGPKARRMTSERFVRELLADSASRGGGSRPDGMLDGAEVRQWLERFGNPSDPARPPRRSETANPPADDLLGEIDPGDLDMKKWLGEA